MSNCRLALVAAYSGHPADPERAVGHAEVEEEAPGPPQVLLQRAVLKPGDVAKKVQPTKGKTLKMC